MNRSNNITAPRRAWHDMGGTSAGPVLRDDHNHALWEKRVDALYTLCAKKGIFTVDALRRILEGFGEEAFESMTYYERWVRAVAENLLETGVITAAELSRRMEDVAARGATYGEASLERPTSGAADG